MEAPRHLTIWALLSRKTQILLVAGGGIIIAWSLDGLFAWWTGAPAGPLKWLSLTITILAVGAAGIASVVWRPLWRRIPLLERKTFPDLTGTWEGHLASTWINPATNERIPPIATTITIRQGLFGTSVKLRTGESTSYSTRCSLEPFPDASRFRLWYSYHNDPKAFVRDRSAPHEGIAWLEMDYDEDADRLVGMYYTARRTTGDIEVQRTPPQRSRRTSH